MADTDYNPNIPLISTVFADWQVFFQRNFSTLYDAFKQNHVSLDAASNAGNHNNLEMFASPQNPETDLSQFSIYSAADSNPDIPVEDKLTQLFMSFQNNTTFQVTSHQVYPLDQTIYPNQTSYFTILPGPMVIFFGKLSSSNSTNPTEFSLYLRPSIMKNLEFINFTASGVNNGQQPGILPLTNQEGFIDQINIFSVVAQPGSNPLPDYFYCIGGNV